MIELLAPAGSFEALRAAVEAGADAVYLAGEKFGARAYAENFAGEQLLHAVEFAHLRGVAVHVTVNTLITDEELDEFAAGRTSTRYWFKIWARRQSSSKLRRKSPCTPQRKCQFTIRRV